MIIYNNTYKYISLLLLLLFLVVPVNAVDSPRVDSLLKISPVLLKIRIEPGSKQIQTITVENRTNAPMPIRASVEGFDPTDEDSGFSPKPRLTISPLSQWISINKPESIIPARSTEEYSVKISVPSTVPIGGYYAIIYFSPFYPGSSITSKIGVIALANIGIQDTMKNKIVIQDFSFTTLLYEKNPLTTQIRLANDALQFFSAKPTLTISPFWGADDSISLDEKILLPGKSRSWKSVFSIQNSKWGVYLVTLTVSMENGESISKTIPVIMLPIRLIFSILFICSFCIFIWKKRHNVSHAGYILFSQNPESGANISTTPISPEIHTYSTRIDPSVIIRTAQQCHGSTTQAAKLLHMHRSTVHRWMQRARDTGPQPLQRRSTKPRTTRTITIPKNIQLQILALRKKEHLTAVEIISHLNLRVSPRTIYRILKSHNLTRTYTTKTRFR